MVCWRVSHKRWVDYFNILTNWPAFDTSFILFLVFIFWVFRTLFNSFFRFSFSDYFLETKFFPALLTCAVFFSIFFISSLHLAIGVFAFIHFWFSITSYRIFFMAHF